MSKTYKCTNYGICTEAEKETVFQETDLEEVDGKFICPKCKQELEEINGGGGHGKLIAIIAAAVIVLGGGTAALLLRGKGDGAKKDGKQSEVIVDTTTVAEQDTTSQDEVIEPEGEESDLDDEAGNEDPQPPTPPKPTTDDHEWGTYDLGWGTYEGGMQGGKPHGTGTVVVTKSHSIDLKNGSSRQVSKGDRLDANFKNGKLTQCYIHYANGQVEPINIGY